MNIAGLAAANAARLRINRYPGRGIILGRSADGTHDVQVYWIMGRSENSRNRVFEQVDGTVRTAPFDAAKVADSSLVIYNALRQLGTSHIVTNGAQTDGIADYVAAGKTFFAALQEWRHEPDPPIFTPRISGQIDQRNDAAPYQISKIVKNPTGDGSVHAFFRYGAIAPGYGFAVHTYREDGDPPPSFDTDPYLVPLGNGAESIAETYWDLLDRDNRVALAVKTVAIADGAVAITIINRHRR